MTDFFQAISNFGFPIVVASYLLFRFEAKFDNWIKIISKSLDKNTRATEKLVTEVKKLEKKNK